MRGLSGWSGWVFVRENQGEKTHTGLGKMEEEIVGMQPQAQECHVGTHLKLEALRHRCSPRAPRGCAARLTG